MPEGLRLVGHRIVAVRPMTAEELDREGWSPESETLCAVLDNGAVLYPGSSDDQPGRGLAQYDGELWTIHGEGPVEVPASHRRPTPETSRAERATLVCALLFSVSAIIMLLLSVIRVGDLAHVSLLGAGAMGQAAAAACLWLLRAFIRVGP